MALAALGDGCGLRLTAHGRVPPRSERALRIDTAVLWRLRYKLGFRDVAELLLQRGYEVTHETIRR